MSFEVTVTPTVYNVEVEVNPSVQPFDVQVITQQDLADLVDESKQYAEDAEDFADSASASASLASASATTATNQANIATNQALLASAARLNAQNAANAAEDSADASAVSASSALASATSAELDAIETSSDRVQTGLDRQATGADRVQTGLDRVATGADRVQTGIDANTALTQAGVATTQAGIATTQAGIATTQAGNALTSANNALNSANAAAASAASAAAVGTSTLLTGFTTGANTTIAGTDTILGAFQKAQGQINARVSGTGVAGQVAFWSGTGTQTGDAKFTYDSVNNIFQLNGTLASPPKFNILNTQANDESWSILDFLGTQSGTGIGARIRANRRGRLQFFTQSLPSITDPTLQWEIDFNGHFNSSKSNRLSTVGLLEIMNRSTGGINFITNSTSAASIRLTIDSSGNLILPPTTGGNLLINTITDAGFRLDVNGTARVQGALTTNLTAGRVPFIGAGGVLSDDASLTFDNTTKLLTVRANSGGTSTNYPAIHVRDTHNGDYSVGGIFGELGFFGQDISGGGSRLRSAIRLINTSGPSGNLNDLVFYQTDSATALNEIFRITYQQRFGILTSAPATTFDVNGTGRIQSTLKVGATTATNASAVLDIESTTQGVLFPRMTGAQAELIGTPADGLLVYINNGNGVTINSTGFWGRAAGAWVKLN
jgi:hypothetical protein